MYSDRYFLQNVDLPDDGGAKINILIFILKFIICAALLYLQKRSM